MIEIRDRDRKKQGKYVVIMRLSIDIRLTCQTNNEKWDLIVLICISLIMERLFKMPQKS